MEIMDTSKEKLYVHKGTFYLDLAPENNYQLAQADMLAHVINDLENMLTAGFKQEDPAKKVNI